MYFRNDFVNYTDDHKNSTSDDLANYYDTSDNNADSNDKHENSTLDDYKNDYAGSTLENVDIVEPETNASVHVSNECGDGGYGYDYNYDDYDYSGSGYHNNSNCSYGYGSYPLDYEYKTFSYEGFDFERPVYTFIWEILVIFTTIFNIVVIVVLLRKRMRNVIHMVLVAIAISDSMTGLVTLPTYIYTYSRYKSGDQNNRDAYILDKDWCNAFMISKFFLSKWFHNVSIWLTLFLCFQRFVSIQFPFKTQRLFTMRSTLKLVVGIFVLSPVLHIFHVIHRKADVKYGLCLWEFESEWSIVQLWVVLVLMYLIPCILLVVMTALMVYRLSTPLSKIMGSDGGKNSTMERRQKRNRRVSIIVSAIVIAFLIPEVPYGIFLLITLTKIHSGNNIMPLIVNRGFHAGYEMLLVLSFHANFWIYTVLNKRFRSELKKTWIALLNLVCIFEGKLIRKLTPRRRNLQTATTAQSTNHELKDLGASSST